MCEHVQEDNIKKFVDTFGDNKIVLPVVHVTEISENIVDVDVLEQNLLCKG